MKRFRHSKTRKQRRGIVALTGKSLPITGKLESQSSLAFCHLLAEFFGTATAPPPATPNLRARLREAHAVADEHTATTSSDDSKNPLLGQLAQRLRERLHSSRLEAARAKRACRLAFPGTEKFVESCVEDAFVAGQIHILTLLADSQVLAAAGGVIVRAHKNSNSADERRKKHRAKYRKIKARKPDYSKGAYFLGHGDGMGRSTIMEYLSGL